MAFYVELYGLQLFFQFFFLMKTIFKTNILYIYIYNKNILHCFFKKRGTVRLQQVFAEPNAYNECLKQFWTLKTKLLAKPILIIFLLWKWIKYIFVLFVLKNLISNKKIKKKKIREWYVFFAEPITIYLIALRCIMNAWSDFEL